MRPGANKPVRSARPKMRQFATVTVISRDKTGVIARVTAFLFEQRACLEASAEPVACSRFCMTLQTSWFASDCHAAGACSGLDLLARQPRRVIKFRCPDQIAPNVSPSWPSRNRTASRRAWSCRIDAKSRPAWRSHWASAPTSYTARQNQTAVCSRPRQRPRAPSPRFAPA